MLVSSWLRHDQSSAVQIRRLAARQALTLTLTQQNPVANVVYDDSTKRFKQVFETLAPSSPAGEKPKIALEFVHALTAA